MQSTASVNRMCMRYQLIRIIRSIETMKTYGKPKNKYGWDTRRKLVAAAALVLAVLFVLAMTSEIFIYLLAM